MSALAFSKDGALLVTSGTDRSRLWTVASEAPPIDLPPSRAAAFAPDGARFALGGRTLAIRRSSDGALLEERDETADGAPRTLSFSADGKTVAWAARTTPVILWDLSHRRAVRRLDAAWTARFSADGKHLVAFPASGPEQPLRILDVESDSWQAPFAVRALHLVFASKTDVFATQEQEGPITVWRLADRASFSKMSDALSISERESAALSADGSLLAYSATPNQATVIKRLADGKDLQRIDNGGYPSAKAFSADGGLLASGRWVWRVRDGALVASPAPPSGAKIGAVSFSADGVLAQAYEGGVFLTRPGDQPSVESHTLPVAATALAFSPDGSYLVTGSEGRLDLWCR